jgi:hypothetical protein
MEGVKKQKLPFPERSGAVRLESKSVFDVNDSRLGIGTFSRPLLDAEARSFRRAWEMEAMPGFDDFQVEAKRVSFLAEPEQVGKAWEAIDRMLAGAADGMKKAS